MARALRLALPLFESESVLVMNGDSFCGINLKAFWSWHYARRARATLALVRVVDTARYGKVAVDREGTVNGFYEKAVGAGPGWISSRGYLIERPVVVPLPATEFVSLERDLPWLDRQGPLWLPEQWMFS